jgi:clan AA aspartic protease (TIGR02281 family)
MNPEEPSSYKQRAQIFYEQGKYDLADADYQKMIELKPGDVMGYMGKGRNANDQKRWNDAIKLFDYVEKLANDYSSVYAFRAEAYIGQEKWNEATDDLVKSLSIDWDRKAMYMMSELKEPAFTMMVSKMRVQSAKVPNDSKWPYLIGTLYEQNKDYEKAAKAYTDANAKEVSPVTYYRMSVCHFALGDFETAMTDIDNALNMDSLDMDYMSYKANIFYEMGKPLLAISQWTKVLSHYPDNYWAYYRRGWFRKIIGDYDNALEDLSMSIVLEPSYTYSYDARADIYLKQGKRELAEADFRKIIEIEDSPEKYECIHYAYQGLGNKEKAIAAMDSIIARKENSSGVYYDAACLYSKMGMKDEALRFMEMSLEKGYRHFAHMEVDEDLDFIRDSEEYKALINKYKSIKAKSTRITDSSVSESNSIIDMTTTEIPFVKEDGVCKVKCSINGLPLHFVFDTGASDVTISTVEATFMMKNGYLNGKDVIGSQRYMDANGDINVGTVINLKSVSIGDFELNNVRASVVRSQKAPLLLGQSVLGRLGKIEIDNPGRVLKIKHQGNVNY